MTTQELQLQKAEVEKNLAAAQRAENIANWKKLRTEARAAKGKAMELLRTFRQAEADWAAYEAKCEEVRQKISEHEAAKPAPEYFPTEQENTLWEQKSARLNDILTVEMRERRLSLAHTKELARHAALSADEIFQKLVLAERNARNIVEGVKALMY
jgi:hypothetical protein